MTTKYQDIYQKSIQDPESFWSEVANDVFWYKKPSKILNSDNPPFYKWFQDGVTNTGYNAVINPIFCVKRIGDAEDSGLPPGTPVVKVVDCVGNVNRGTIDEDKGYRIIESN